MKNSFKLLSAVSAIFLLAACENTGAGNGGVGGSGFNSSDASSAAAAQTDLEQNVGDRVFFGYDSSVLTSEGQATLDKQAAWLKQNPAVSVTVEGHCDERGTREYNIALGERRASAAKSYLTSAGVESNRVAVISYGKERPAVTGSSEESFSQNRRAVTVVGN